MSYRAADVKTRLLGKPCLVADYPGAAPGDRLVVGKYGAIWQYAPDIYFVLITSPRLYSKHFNDTLKAGDEVGVLCNEEEAKRWLQRLKVSRIRESQLTYWQAITDQA